MASEPVASGQGHCLVEIRTTDAMGKGLFAIKNIPRGTQILAEVPILAIPAGSQVDLDDDLPAFCAALRDLPKTEWKRLDELYCNTALITLERRAKIREWYKEKGITDKVGAPLNGKKLQDVAKAATKRFAIFLTNRAQMGFADKSDTGVFSYYSRINHSCVPNVHNSYNPGLQRLTLYSVRDVSAGEQITTSYFDSACRTRQQRRQETENWGFVCSCIACSDPSTEPVRARLFKLDQRLALYESPLRKAALSNPSPMARLFARSSMPLSLSEALTDAEELAELLKKQGLEGMPLGRAYRECSKYSIRLGLMSKAVEYAQKELDNERYCIGTETAHLQKDMVGAEYWLAHLQRLDKAKGSVGSSR